MSLFSKNKSEEPQNIEQLLEKFKELQDKCMALQKEVEMLRKENLQNLNKLEIIRYNPFQGFGGNQSFSLALLNGEANGIVITSLLSREGNRVYGKPVKNGISEFQLTEEEKQVIELAKNQNRIGQN